MPLTLSRALLVAFAGAVFTAACSTALTSSPVSSPPPVADTAARRVSPPAAVANQPADQHVSPTMPAGAGIVLPDSLDDGLRRAIAEAGAAIGLTADVLFGDGTLASRSTEADEPRWDLDVLSYATHDQVARYVTLFSGSARQRIQSRLQRGKQYEPMIRAKFRAGGIPEDMYYLGLVESGYDPHAYSRAAAVGMWQFMSSTARGVGLRVDHWVDERRDPVKSTDAAARFLSLLYRQFGSYYLAAAAYNGGPGRVSRGLARFQDELQEAEGDDRFFALAEQSYLRSETRNYVPQLIAAALIGKAPARYGMVVSDSVAAFSYDSVRVPELTSLGSVARAIGRPVQEVRDLNPHLLRGVTPPRTESIVRLPVGMALVFDSMWTTTDDADRVAFTRVRSTRGQTLTKIGRANGIEPRQMSWYNPGFSATRSLPVGKEILVPALHVVAAARDVPDPSIERYGSSPAAGRVVHVVRRGESLGSIAMRYRTTVATLQRANGLRRTVVYPGQSIIVRASARGKVVRRASGSRRVVSRAGTVPRSVAARKTAKGNTKASQSKRSTVKPPAKRTVRPSRGTGRG